MFNFDPYTEHFSVDETRKNPDHLRAVALFELGELLDWQPTAPPSFDNTPFPDD
jgi:hypothetical protein